MENVHACVYSTCIFCSYTFVHFVYIDFNGCHLFVEVLEENSGSAGTLCRLRGLSLLLLIQGETRPQAVCTHAARLLCSQGHLAPYGEGAVCLHGLSVRYKMKMPCMLFCITAISSLCLHLKQYLPKHLHLLCVDMPGHEGTTRTNTDDYSIQGQVKRIRQVMAGWAWFSMYGVQIGV